MSHIRTPSGRRIFYDIVGDGPPLLAITGWTGSGKHFLASLDEVIRSRFTVIAIDNRDAGESDPEPAYYTIADVASDAIALLDALGVDRVHILGASMGATVALQAALDHPDRVDRLVLVSGHAHNEPEHQAGDPLPPVPEWWTDDPVERWRRLLPEIVSPAYRSRLTDADVDRDAEADRGNRVTWAGAMRQMAMRSGLDMRGRLAEVQAPTLVIHGGMDVVVPPEHAEMLVAGIPGARLLMLPRAGHLPLTEEPDEVTRAILGFLAN